MMMDIVILMVYVIIKLAYVKIFHTQEKDVMIYVPKIIVIVIHVIGKIIVLIALINHNLETIAMNPVIDAL